MKKHLLLFVAFAVLASFFSFNNPPKPAADGSKIHWLTWEEMLAAQKKEKKKVFIDVYTEWCGWCKKMDASTFVHPEIVKYVNKNFYAVKFDAETRQEFSYNGKVYKYVPQGMRGYNELAAEMLNGRMGYPTTVYYDENMSPIFPVPGYQTPQGFETLLTFIASNSYKTTTWEKYQAEFKGKIQ